MGSISLVALLLLGSTFIPAISAAGSVRPRGVGPEFSKFYKDPDTFTCISNPAIHLSIAQVNDDYCDCPDGSDEPGTAACAYLSPLSPRYASDPLTDDINITMALPGFYCKNKGHMPSYIPFMAVNDGICDHEQCCDGSDEQGDISGVTCEDRCQEMGAAWRKRDEARQKSLTAASQRRQELVRDAQTLRKQVEDRVKTLRTELEGANIMVSNLKRELADAQQREKERLARRPIKNAGTVSAFASAVKQRLDALREALQKACRERDASRDRVKELEGILAQFKDEYNPNFNDEGVKRAVKAWEDYAARETGSDGDASHDWDIDEYLKHDIEGVNWDDFGTGGGDGDILYRFDKLVPGPVRSWVDTGLRSVRQVLIDNRILPENDGSDIAAGESQAVKDARSRLENAENDLKNRENELEDHENDLGKSYGPDDVFRALKDQCFSTDSGEYTYELCYMGKTWQKAKKGGGSTNMGSFVRIETIIVDDDIGADGKGLGSGERMALKYENGQNCWNGPSRTTTVILACAEKDEIWRVREEEKCVYRMEVGSPAVCDNQRPRQQGRPAHDEL